MEDNRVFLDANIFIAQLNKDDALHKKATKCIQQLETKQAELVTSNFILDEVITVLSQRVNKRIALTFAEYMYGPASSVDVLTVDRVIEERALHHLKLAKSKNISMTDCTTLALLEVEKITKLATYDKDLRPTYGKFVLV